MCHVSIIEYQLSAVNSQISFTNYRLSIINYQLSIMITILLGEVNIKYFIILLSMKSYIIINEVLPLIRLMRDIHSVNKPNRESTKQTKKQSTIMENNGEIQGRTTVWTQPYYFNGFQYKRIKPLGRGWGDYARPPGRLCSSKALLLQLEYSIYGPF